MTLAALFGPQHGFRSNLQDNMIETPHGRDCRRQVPVYSLYSETREPTAEMLKDIDVLVVDLQDVGTRVYTFVYTMANCMRAAARHGVRVVVCDRPNPIGGDAVEGALLREPWTSFVGQFPIPLRHGMTIGELARLFNDEFGIGCALDVVPLDGLAAQHVLRRDGAAVGDPVAQPADARQRRSSTRAPCCSRGRRCRKGAARPGRSSSIGAPWIDGERLADAMNARALPGVHFRPVFFEPTFQKHARADLRRLPAARDRSRSRSSRCARRSSSSRSSSAQDPARFAWRQPPYEYEHDKEPIDILYGVRRAAPDHRPRRRRRPADPILGGGRGGLPAAAAGFLLTALGFGYRHASQLRHGLTSFAFGRKARKAQPPVPLSG